MPNNVLDHAAEVVPGIYIGSVDSAMLASMPDYPVRIDAIVDLSGYTYTTSIISLHILMDDAILTEQTLPTTIDKFTRGSVFIQRVRALGGNVLIHCAAGINRSATQIGAYLIDTGMTYDQVLGVLSAANAKRNRPLLTNPSFRELLAQRALHSTTNILK